MSTPALREVNWGEGLVVAAFRSRGGIKVAVDRIQAAVGLHIGTRNTFGKLLQVADPGDLRERDLFRAWLLVSALGQEPGEWGLNDDVVPAMFDRDDLKYAIRDSNPEPADYASAALTRIAAVLPFRPRARSSAQTNTNGWGATVVRLEARASRRTTSTWRAEVSS